MEGLPEPVRALIEEYKQGLGLAALEWLRARS